MIKIAISGACGRMGQEISIFAHKDKELKLCGLLEKPKSEYIGREFFGLLVTDKIDSIIKKIDVLIDFSSPENCTSNIASCSKYGKAIVIGTTGLNEKCMEEIKHISNKIPVLVSSNMSIGVSVLCKIASVAARLLKKEYDINIVEKHHRYKKDKPSGTALMLARSIKKPQVQIQSIRAGDIIGEHEILFAGNNELLKLSHIAGSRALFAIGALKAAKFVAANKAKLYSMSDVLNINGEED